MWPLFLRVAGSSSPSGTGQPRRRRGVAVPSVQPAATHPGQSRRGSASRFVRRMTFRQQILRCGNEISARQAQCRGELQNRREGRHVLASLDFADVASLYPGKVR